MKKICDYRRSRSTAWNLCCDNKQRSFIRKNPDHAIGSFDDLFLERDLWWQIDWKTKWPEKSGHQFL